VTPGFTLAYRASRFEIGTLMLDRILQPWLVYSGLTLSSLLILVGLGMRAWGDRPYSPETGLLVVWISVSLVAFFLVLLVAMLLRRRGPKMPA
jgi:hypothetical protein